MIAEENVHAPTRTDEQLDPIKACLPIGKSNLLMDLQKKQQNLIFLISVDILQNTNFFRAFTASADVPSIYPKDSAHPFVLPPDGDLIIDFVKGLDLQKPKKTSITDQYVFLRRSLVTLDASTGPSTQPQDDTSTNVVHDTLSLSNSTNNVETGADTKKSNIEMNTEILYIEEERGEEVSNMMALEERTIELHEAGPNPEPMHEDFVATVYLEVHESLKLTTEEQVYIENPPSLSGTLSSMRNLDDAFTFVDQFLNDKSLEEESRKVNVETEVESMVTTTTTTTPLPPPPQNTTDLDLSTYVSTLQKRSADFKQKHQIHDKTTKALASKVYKLEHHDLYSKIENKLMRSHLDHTTLYEALELSIQSENIDELHEALTTSRKRRCDDQDPPLPPLKNSDRFKKKKWDSDKKPSSLSVHPVDDNPFPEAMHLSESKDTSVAHLSKIKTRLDLLKHVLEKYIPKTPKLDWVIPPNDLPETENNWADALAKTYIDPEEYKLHWKTGDMGSFIKCKPLPLGGPPGQVKFNLNTSPKRLGISCIRLEELVPSLWTECERNYNIISAYTGGSNYTIVHKPRAVIYRDRNNQKKMMRETEVHKFSDGTLMRILEKLDYMVKDYELFKFNPGMKNMIWTKDDKQRSQEFIKLIERRLKIRRIFRSLESFVSGLLRDINYRHIQRTK
nr:hypothetical protein [Tanacetum cinerariifolium]